MEGLMDNRPPLEIPAPEPVDSADGTLARTEAEAPRQVKVILTPITQGTLVTIVTQEWNGRMRMEQRVAALRLFTADRLGWAVAPQEALAATVRGLAAYLDA